ncbi:50S ribosomal protein L3 [Candidatus Micrarchaeota archaeon]|nr:50S ribosomal protein L3 [Candidatus Micrarchaeota archaeon]
MAKEHSPGRGSRMYRPRKRASSQVARVSSWPKINDIKLLGFAGYKAGMTHVSYIDETRSHLKGREIVTPVTIIETPPMIVYGIRFYKKGKIVGVLLTDDKNILNEIKFKKRAKQGGKNIEQKEFDDIRVLVFTQPKLTKIGKKKIERMEIAIGGKDINSKLQYAKSILGKEVHAKDIFKAGEFIDVIAVTKGKGWQGVVKRFGIPLNRPKATKRRRHGGVLGGFKPPYVSWTIPRAGQMGYHKRTEYNKWLMKIGTKEDSITPKGGISHYGTVENDYILIKGSVPGTKKRMIRIRKSIRAPAVLSQPKITYISKESQH